MLLADTTTLGKVRRANGLVSEAERERLLKQINTTRQRFQWFNRGRRSKTLHLPTGACQFALYKKNYVRTPPPASSWRHR